MVTKITIFEPHFDGAQFGPASLGEQDRGDTAESTAETHTDSHDAGERSRIRSVLLLGGVVAAVLIGSTILRRRRQNRSDTVENEAQLVVE